MKSLVILDGDQNLLQGMQDTFGAGFQEIAAYSSDNFDPKTVFDVKDNTIFVMVAGSNIDKLESFVSYCHENLPKVFQIAISQDARVNQKLFAEGVDIILNDKHYWLPLLAQIRAIMRRISYNRILAKQTPRKTKKLDPLNINPASVGYGVHRFKEYTAFKLFHPDADHVDLELYESYEKENPFVFKMLSLGDGDWGLVIQQDLLDWYYGYRATKHAKRDKYLIADPYSKYLTTTNNHLQYPKTKIIKQDFDWKGDTFVIPGDIRDLVIYETHLKDFVGETKPHTNIYQAFCEKALPYLKKLGVNAIEFLPLQKFAYHEPPFQSEINSWNPFEVNYWGYMTTGYFAPETIYSTDGSTIYGEISGRSGSAINEFKEMVRTCHDQGFTVIMDVVYNHISNYDLNPLRLISEDYYLRKNDDGSLRSDSGCGNDFKTENEKARRLIIDSILYWMQEYHIDGFRFDLAQLIDKETFIQLRKEAMMINPKVILIAEPWGGGYDPAGFSNIEYLGWNDQIRNGVKGSKPDLDRGFIFGEWHHGNSRFSLENYLKGSLQGHANGLFKQAFHSINYLESHDGYTLGDFIRYGTGDLPMGRRLKPENFEKLTPQQMSIAKLAALFLMVSQGIPMIHAGQEFARAKWNPPLDMIEDPFSEQLSHDSYNRDNATNYIQWQQKELNESLWKYYKALIQIRKDYPCLRLSKSESFSFHPVGNDLVIVCSISGYISADPYDLLLVMNANQHELRVTLPDSDWEEILNPIRVSPDGNGFVRGELFLAPTSGYLFRKLRD